MPVDWRLPAVTAPAAPAAAVAVNFLPPVDSLPVKCRRQRALFVCCVRVSVSSV
eukprot:m.1919 g.1919  ORF g.1919 m.1919 type:complete len:54 (-) comp878_c0_seq1:75-236(-)